MTDIARAMDEAGRQLQARYGDGAIPSSEIEELAEKIGGLAKDRVFAADYCYNRVNRAEFSFQHPLFEYVERGWYRYLGPDFAYSGEIIWKPQGEEERVVGRWINGSCRLDEDPRQ